MQKSEISERLFLDACARLVGSVGKLDFLVKNDPQWVVLAPYIDELVQAYLDCCRSTGWPCDLRSRIGDVGRSPKPPRRRRGK